MLKTLAINNYRSLLNLVIPLGQLNVITGANGSGKSNLYRALRLLAETAQGGVVNALAKEGGLESTFWAGPETISRGMKRGEHAIEGLARKEVKRMRLGFAGDDFSYAISLGLPEPLDSFFQQDPEIKCETMWTGDYYRPASAYVERQGPLVKTRFERKWDVIATNINSYDSIFSQVADNKSAYEVVRLREAMRSWRFYDHFDTGAQSVTRRSHIGTRTPILGHDGSDLAAAIQTIIEVGDETAFADAVDDAFPGCRVHIVVQSGGLFEIAFYQKGLLRPLNAAELSDGTLRYLLLITALLTPRPPLLLVLNEPENSLHPDLLPALARLIIKAAAESQVWVVSHAARLVAALEQAAECHSIHLEKALGQTTMRGLGMLDEPPWHWPDKK